MLFKHFKVQYVPPWNLWEEDWERWTLGSLAEGLQGADSPPCPWQQTWQEWASGSEQKHGRVSNPCHSPAISEREREVSMIIITNNLFVTVFIILIISPAGKLSCTDDKAECMIIWCWWCYKHPQLITWTFQVFLTYYWMAVITSKIKCTDTDKCMHMYWNVLFYSAFLFNKIKCMSFH